MEKMGEGNRKYNIWLISFLIFTVSVFLLIGGVVVYIDPFFHYHAPLNRWGYLINDERYQNDGIIRNFEYDGIITGTSMTENFKTSEANILFGAKFIKVPFSGGTYREIRDNCQRAYKTGKDIRYVVSSLDYNYLIRDKDAYSEYIYPSYLYDDNIFNDVNYVWNKYALSQTLNAIIWTWKGFKTTTFDSYVNWNDRFTFGKDAVLATYTLENKVSFQNLTSEEREMLLGNIRQNVIDLAVKHPETTYYLFLPPYSICYWDSLINCGGLNRHVEAERLAIEEILKVSNIKLYSFYNNFDLVCNLDNYKDQTHYGEWINSWILEQMQSDEYLLTKENYMEYLTVIKEFYGTYDYNWLRE